MKGTNPVEFHTMGSYDPMTAMKPALANMRVDHRTGLKILRAEADLPDGARFEIVRGHRPFDYVGSTTLGVYLISRKAAEVWTGAGLTGLRTKRVEVEPFNGQELEYFLLQIEGRCGVVRPSVLGRGARMNFARKFSFDIDTWSGADIFLSANRQWRLVTGRFVAVTKKSKLLGPRFEALDQEEESFQEEEWLEWRT